MRDFDAVIIGAGLGGLSAAAKLARSGLKVVLLERHSVPGGYASSFVRGRFEFDVSLHQLSGVGGPETPGPLYRLLEEQGVLPKVEFVKIADCYRAVFPDVDVTVPIGRDNFERALIEAFPSEAESIKRFSELVFGFFMEAMAADVMRNGLTRITPEKHPLLCRHVLSTMAEAVFPIVTDEKLRCVISQLANYVGQPPSRVAFMTYAMALTTYVLLGPVHIRGTSQALSQAFVEVIEENGGQVWLSNGADRIETKDGRVCGVVAQDGTRLAAPRVVSNANPFETLVNLVGADYVPDWYLKRLSVWTPGVSTFNVWLGLDKPADHFGFDVHETFVGFDYDLDRMYEEASVKALNLNPPGAAVTAYNLADPEFSPPGTTNVVITMGAYGGPWSRLSPAEHLTVKSLQADKGIEIAEMVAPGIRKHIEVMETASPMTNRRYTLNPGGSFTGFTENRHPGGAMQIPCRTPIEGLYLGSAWVNMGGGYMPSMVNGHRAASELLEDMKGQWDFSAQKEAMVAQTPAGQTIDGARADRPASAEGRPFADRLRLRVEQVIQETPSTATFRLSPLDSPGPAFRAGQYLTVFVNVSGTATSRAYSIASPPGADRIDITVRRKPGGFVSPYLLDEVKPGQVLEAGGPHGTFFHEPAYDSKDIVLLAGGSGVTPMASMIRQAAAEGRDGRIHLLYGSRDPEDIIFKDELLDIAQKHSNIKVDFVISEPPAGYDGPTGFLGADLISSLVGPVEDRTFFICGPGKMHELCTAALQQLGVPGRRIKKEAYGPPDDPADLPGWPGLKPDAEFEVVEERSGRRIKVTAGEPLMNGLERAGLVIPSACRSGECTACRTRLLEGRVFTPDTVARRRIDERAGMIHPCMSYPVSDLKIKL